MEPGFATRIWEKDCQEDEIGESCKSKGLRWLPGIDTTAGRVVSLAGTSVDGKMVEA
jgi:hypothetical protein